MIFSESCLEAVDRNSGLVNTVNTAAARRTGPLLSSGWDRERA